MKINPTGSRTHYKIRQPSTECFQAYVAIESLTRKMTSVSLQCASIASVL